MPPPAAYQFSRRMGVAPQTKTLTEWLRAYPFVAGPLDHSAISGDRVPFPYAVAPDEAHAVRSLVGVGFLLSSHNTRSSCSPTHKAQPQPRKRRR